MAEDNQDIPKGNLHFVLLIATYVIYLALGGVIFSYLEQKDELKAVDDINKVVKLFLEKHRCIKRQEVEEFVGAMQAAVERGLRVKGNLTYNPNWNFGGAILFAASLLTTIGYGDLAPSSNVCRMFCIVYAIIGIPMTATLLSTMVDRWTRCVEIINNLITRHMNAFELEARVIHMLLTFIVIIIAACVVFIFPAFFIAKLEGWTYFESVYFCFITMTTVGLGDYVPGCSEKWTNSTTRIVYKVSLVFYFIVGLSFVFLILDLSGKVPETAPSLLFSCESRISYRNEHQAERAQANSGSNEIARNR